MQINGGLTGTNTFNVNGVGTNFSLDLILNGSGYTNGDVVNLNANLLSNDFTIDQVQTINVATNVGLTVFDTPDQGDVNWTAGQSIVFNSGSSLTTTTGDGTGNINLIAKGGLTTVNSIGILVNTTSITSTDGTITLTGTASGTATGTDNHGIRVQGTNSKISSVDGAIAVTGTGGSGTSFNYGVCLFNGGAISSTGAATITVTGQGSNTVTANNNEGVRIDGTNSKISSVDGAIIVTGTGSSSGTGNNFGVFLRAGGAISSTGTATINVTGQAGGAINTTGTLNQGIRLNAGNITSVDGAITVSGTGGNGTDSNSGVILVFGSSITSTGTGAITVTGTSGTGTTSDGIRLENTGSKIQSSSGSINLTGTASGANFGINLLSGTLITSTTGNINLLSSTINLDNTASITTAGNVFINQDSDVPVGATTLGATVNVTAGNLYLNDTIKVDYNASVSRFDTINLTGAVDLVGSALNLDLTGYTAPAANTFYTLINNDGTDAVTGTFTGLAEGAQVGVVGDAGIFITYKGNATSPSLANIGTGNDVQLYVNRRPTDLSLSANSINENVAANSLIGTFSSTDPDAGSTFTYSFVNGTNDNSAFTISGNQLLINASPNFEAKSSYSILVRTTDQGGLSYDKALTININDINENPSVFGFSAANYSVNEDGTTSSAITINRTANTTGAASVTVNLGGGTATATTDYNSSPITVNFADGETSKTLVVPIVLDSITESVETVNLSLTNPTGAAYGATLGGFTTSVLSIVDFYNRPTSNQNETIVAPSGTSVINVSTGSGNDTINLTNRTGNVFASAGLGNDSIFGGSGNDVLNGGLGNDIIKGNAGVDRLFGDAGSDTLYGGLGNDQLTGGAGADIFALETASGSDIIFDFVSGTDLFGLTDALSFGSLSFNQSGANTQILSGGSLLATVLNLTASTINAGNFVSLP